MNREVFAFSGYMHLNCWKLKKTEEKNVMKNVYSELNQITWFN